MLLSIKSPGKRGNSCRGEGDGWGLVEADAGYVGGFDVVGCIVVPGVWEL